VICSTIIADPVTVKPDCDKVLNACLDYTKTLEVERDFLSVAIKRQDQIIRDLESKQSSQPWYFWVLIGAASGIVLTGVR
jgi:hypothetical protein